MNVELTLAEAQFLADILEEHHRQLQLEIIHTDHKDFKMRLREKEKILDALIDKIVVSRAAGA